MMLAALAFVFFQDAPPANPPIPVSAIRSADLVADGDGVEVFAEFVLGPPIEEIAVTRVIAEALDGQGAVIASRRITDERDSRGIVGSMATYHVVDGSPAGTPPAILRSHVGVFFLSGWRLPTAEGVARLRMTFTVRTSRGWIVSQAAECDAAPAAPVTHALPLSGEWSVLWGVGHDSPHRRGVFFSPRGPRIGSRYAYDFARVDDRGMLASGAGLLNEEYFGWDQEVRASADGTVVRVVNDVPDHPPGWADPRMPPGNHVIVSHADGTYSCYAHLRMGSVTAREGDAVAVGQALGRVGNSGSSAVPHLHFQVTDEASYYQSQGRPAAFSNVTVQGASATGMLRSGWVVVAQ